jgi:cytochrome c oxidase assembly factor CtaG
MVPVHAGGPLRWHDVPRGWVFDVPAIATITLATGGYLLGRRRRPPAADRPFAATIAFVGCVVALLSPLDSLAAALLSAHMVQHLLLVFVVAPALAIARPWRSWRLALPSRARHALPKFMHSLAAVHRLIARRPVGAGVTATALAIGTLWGWHTPALYEAALRHPPVHALEHVTLVASWTPFWAVTARLLRRHREPSALAMLAALSVSGNALGMLLVFTTNVWYPHYRSTSDLGITPLADQQLAGIIMWVVPGLLTTVWMAATFLRWLGSTAAPSPLSHAPAFASGDALAELTSDVSGER